MLESKDPLVERSRERVGITLKDKWRLDALLGVGGMAAVYSATHRNGMRVAVKMLHPELSINPEVRTRFLREGYVANRVEHSGAVTVLDDDATDDGAVFLVMELLDGETLAHRFERKARSLAAPQILLITDQVLDVLVAAHEKQIVHRDIKPDNIFLTRSGGVKLLDFGIARLRELSTQSSATRSGSTMGTPAYMAPEQARARWDEVDGRTDLWAVGATMFKLLTGRVVHVADTLNEQLLAAMTLPAPPIATLVPTAPIPLVEIVDKALAFERENRWPDARQMQQATRSAFRAITGVAATSGRVSLIDDSESRLNEADTVAAASKVPTSLSVARDSASFRTRKTRRTSVLGRLMLVGALAAGAYLVLGHPRRLQLFGEKDAAIQKAKEALDLPDLARSLKGEPMVVPSGDPGTLVTGGVDDGGVADPSALAASPTVARTDTPAAALTAPAAEAVTDPPEPPAESAVAPWLAAPGMSAAPIVSALVPGGPAAPAAAARAPAAVRPKAAPPKPAPHKTTAPAKKHVTRHHR
jgi:serine/threonine-protein kinase